MTQPTTKRPSRAKTEPAADPKKLAAAKRVAQKKPREKRETHKEPAPRKRKAKSESDPNWQKGRDGRPQEWAGIEKFGAAHPKAIEASRKINMLKQLIEPNTPELVQAMMDIALDRKTDKDGNVKEMGVHPSIRLEAASRLLDRAFGKPKESLEINDITERDASADEVTKLLNGILEKVGAPLLAPPSEDGLPGTESPAPPAA